VICVDDGIAEEACLEAMIEADKNLEDDGRDVIRTKTGMDSSEARHMYRRNPGPIA